MTQQLCHPGIASTSCASQPPAILAPNFFWEIFVGMRGNWRYQSRSQGTQAGSVGVHGSCTDLDKKARQDRCPVSSTYLTCPCVGWRYD